MALLDPAALPPVPPPVLLHWLHDVRNPVAALVTNLHHVHGTRSTAVDPEAAEVLGECLALCSMLERYLDNLEVLAQQRRERGRPDVHLAEVARDVGRRLAAQAALTGHTLAVVGSADPVVAAEGALLRMAIENLVANAVEQSPDGEVQLQIDQRGDRAAVWVVDGGPAWTLADVERLFSLPGDIGPARGRARLGRGLGLVAASSAAHAAGARLLLEPDASGSLRVGIVLPLASPEEA